MTGKGPRGRPLLRDHILYHVVKTDDALQHKPSLWPDDLDIARGLMRGPWGKRLGWTGDDLQNAERFSMTPGFTTMRNEILDMEGIQGKPVPQHYDGILLRLRMTVVGPWGVRPTEYGRSLVASWGEEET